MPFPSFCPDGPSHGPSLPSSNSFASRPYYTPRLPQQSIAKPPKNSPTTALSRTHGPDKEQQLSPAVSALSATTPPPLSILPTPPSSNIRPTSERPPTDTTDHGNAPYPIVVKANTPRSGLHTFTPDALLALRASRESSFIFRNIHPDNFSNWEAEYPELYEANDVRYDYDGLSQRMIIKCMAGSVHDSFPIYFTRVVNRGLDRVGPECQRALQIFASTDFCNFKGPYADTHTRKSPDAYIRVAGSRGFPSRVVEVGWAESMDDLVADARLWLLGTSGQTKVVIIVNFTEDKRDTRSPIASAPSGDDGTDVEDTGPESAGTDIEDDDGEDADPDTAAGEVPEPTEEERLLSTVNSTTSFSALAASILELHLRGALAVPLLGSITATFHVFRRTADTIYEEFTTPVLPAPDPTGDSVQSYTLTLADMYGDNELPAGEDPDHRFVMDMNDFRRDIAYPVPDMEEKRSLDRAEAVLKRRGVWQGKATFAGSKKAKRKRGEGDWEEEYREKKAR